VEILARLLGHEKTEIIKKKLNEEFGMISFDSKEE